MIDNMIIKLLHYKAHILAGLGAVLLIADRVITLIVDAKMRGSPWAVVYGLEKLMLHGVFIGIFLAAVIYAVTTIYYSDATGGRNLFRDKRYYHRTFFELLRVYRDADSYRMKPEDLPIVSWKHAQGIILGRAGPHLIHRSTWDHEGDGANFALFALPGAGKTTSQIIPSALRFGGSVLAIDIKGDILHATNGERHVKIFAPNDPYRSEHFNPLQGIERMSMSERKTFLEQMAMTLIPAEQGQDSKYFTDGARDLFAAIALFQITENPGTTLPDIARSILTASAFDWIEKIRESDVRDAGEYSNSYYDTNETNVSGCYNELAKRIRKFASGELAEIMSDNGQCLSAKTLDNGYDIYVEIPQDKIHVLAPATTLFVQKFMMEFEKREDKSSGKMNQPVLFLLDEIAQLNLDGETLTAALSTFRSKSVSVFMAMQSIGQLREKYGENRTREIIDTCAYVSVMSAQDPESREYFEKLFGTRKILKATSNDSAGDGGWWGADSHSGSSSRGAQEEREPVFRAEVFSNLNDKVAILANGKYILADKCKWYE